MQCISSCTAHVRFRGVKRTWAFATPAGAEDDPSISTMLKEGWQIAGYSQASDNRSTFILFRHLDQTYLVQCRAGYDATRTPRTHSICYRLE
jgi:hypothetical protein